MTLKPTRNRIFIEQVPPDEKVSGLHIPEQYRTSGQAYWVHEVGAGVDGVKKGDRVLVKDHAGEKWEYEGRNYKIVNRDDLIAVIGE